MNLEILKWIKEHRQPWRKKGESHTEMNVYAKHYFSRIGKNIENNTYEDLLDDELVTVYNSLLGCLSPSERILFNEQVAIGYSRTFEPNACCIKVYEGYAILFDQSFDSLLISLTEQFFATYVAEPRLLSHYLYPGITNNSILSIFFGLTEFYEPIDVNHFIYREEINKWVYSISNFILAHEIAHIILGHHQENNVSKSFFTSNSKEVPNLKYEKTIHQEFEADEWAIRFILKNTHQIKFDENEPWAKDESLFWGWTYMRIGWLFTILSGIDSMSSRIKEPLGDTHPSAKDRWERVRKIILEVKNVHIDSMNFTDSMNKAISISVDEGVLPPLDYSLMNSLILTRIKYQKQ